MAGYLDGKAVLVIGAGDAGHRAVVVALAEAGASVAIGGVALELSAEAALHSISNEVWALGKKSAVVTLAKDDKRGIEEALEAAKEELGVSTTLVVRCEDGAVEMASKG